MSCPGHPEYPSLGDAKPFPARVKNAGLVRDPLGCPPSQKKVTTRITTFLVGNPYKPSFATVTGWGGRSKGSPTEEYDNSETVTAGHGFIFLYVFDYVFYMFIWFFICHGGGFNFLKCFLTLILGETISYSRPATMLIKEGLKPPTGSFFERGYHCWIPEIYLPNMFDISWKELIIN